MRLCLQSPFLRVVSARFISCAQRDHAAYAGASSFSQVKVRAEAEHGLMLRTQRGIAIAIVIVLALTAAGVVASVLLPY
jgi:hypothetical protein